MSRIQIVRRSDYVTMPWKNGHGVTHEIRTHAPDGRLAWRLSLAEVSADGPFSAFAGLDRILTVVRGAGMELQAADRTLLAAPLSPLAFPGDLPVEGRRLSERVENFNLIYDRSRVVPHVHVLDGARDVVPHGPGQAALFVVSGQVRLAGGPTLEPGDTAIMAADAAPQIGAARCVWVAGL